ncbi:MAG: DUF3579 domain-containing protein [Nitrosomonas sp.]
MKVEPIEWLILGVTPNGRIFRPSDWAERLCGALAHYDSHGRWVYSIVCTAHHPSRSNRCASENDIKRTGSEYLPIYHGLCPR